MRVSGVRGVVVVALLLAALGLGVASTHGSASAQAPVSNTITTQLQPGWNMIGWMGTDTTADELFDAIPALNLIVAWEADAQRYRWAWRPTAGSRGLHEIHRGWGLALYVLGEAAVEWTRPAAEGVVLLRLRAGTNLVTWSGLDGTPIEEALDWLGDAVVGASRWNAATRASERYRPGAPPSANTLRTLNHGDALWVRLSERGGWWQSSPKRIEFVLHGDVRLTQEQESEYRAELAHVQAFFLERYGIEPPEFSVHFFHGPAQVAVGGGDRIAVYWPADDPPEDVPWAHEYFHLLQGAVGPGLQGVFEAPEWIIEGSAEYAANVYSQARWKTTDKGYRWFLWSQSRGIAALRPLEDAGRFQATGNAGYVLAALATDWLVRRAAGLSTDNVLFTPDEPSGLDAQTNFDSYIQYFRLLAAAATWQEAFEAAFGIAVDDFYEAFEKYRRGGFIPLPPHVSDDRVEPVLELVGEIPPSRAAQIRMDFEAFQSFFRDRLGSGPADYTVFVAADGDAERSAYLNLFAEEHEPGRTACAARDSRIGVYVALRCYKDLPLYLATQHYDDARARAYPGLHLLPWGPYWLRFAAIGYMAYGGQVAAGIGTLDRIRIGRAAVARRTTLPLSSMQTAASVRAMDPRVAAALGFLAGDWLVRRAGERSLFKYYELLVLFQNWEEAFEGAFGISVTDFYTAFEAYRSEIVPPLPHLADDRDEPILLFLGAIPEGTQTALRAKFGDVQTLFRERFGTEPVDYTLYITADLRSAADTYRRTVGGELTHLGCWQGRDGVVLVVVVTCATSPRNVDPLVELHHDAVVLQLAPWESLPAASRSGVSPWGPEWLTGTTQYAEAAYRAATGRETFEESRNRLRIMASRTEQPLLHRHEDAVSRALRFLAADWLAQRAGEPALFEYYRLLPSSDSWQEAFKGAFGIAIDDFYAAFAEYRAGL